MESPKADTKECTSHSITLLLAQLSLFSSFFSHYPSAIPWVSTNTSFKPAVILLILLECLSKRKLSLQQPTDHLHAFRQMPICWLRSQQLGFHLHPCTVKAFATQTGLKNKVVITPFPQQQPQAVIIQNDQNYIFGTLRHVGLSDSFTPSTGEQKNMMSAGGLVLSSKQ